MPLLFFGDEGRGPRRSTYLEGTIECPIGLFEKKVECDCRSCLQDMPTHWLPPCDRIRPSTPLMASIANVGHNYKGHSFLTKYFCFGLPGFQYGTRKEMLEKHLDLVAEDLIGLFKDGVKVETSQFYGALIGSKGDLKFQAQTVAKLHRSYANVGSVNNIPMCSLCLAGSDNVEMEDDSLEPGWLATLFQDRPWADAAWPSICNAPFDESKPEWLLKLDHFHIFKVGLARDIAASGIVWLCDLGVFDDPKDPTCSKAVGERLPRAHGAFRLFCLGTGKTASLRSFSKSFFNYPNKRAFPWTSSKGSDSVLLLEFVHLQFKLLLASGDHPLHEAFACLMVCMIENSLDMLHVLYSHNLWLPRECASRLYLHIMAVVRAYKRVAKICFQQKKALFRLKPKWHGLAHLAQELRTQLSNGNPLILNPTIYACEQNEDHIGRTARLSRKLNTKTLSLRMCQRYCLKSKALFRRHLLQAKEDKRARS